MLDRSVCIVCGIEKWGDRYESMHANGILRTWACPADPSSVSRGGLYSENVPVPKGCTHLLEQGVAASLRGDTKSAE